MPAVRNYVDRLKWAALVAGCAAPVAGAVWSNLDVSGRAAMAIGIACWIAAVVPVVTAIQRRQSTLSSRDVMNGAGLLMAIEAIGALLVPYFAFAVYAPAVLLAAWLELIPNTSFDFVPAFVMTALCGAQALACAYLFGNVIRLARIGLDTLGVGRDSRALPALPR